MSGNSLFGKVEALMRKHRGDAISQNPSATPPARQAPAPDAWLPVLTDVVQRGSPPRQSEPYQPAFAGPPGAARPMDEPADSAANETQPQPPVIEEAGIQPAPIPASVRPPEPVSEAAAGAQQPARLAENLIDELTPKISGLMQEQVAEELRKSLNQSMASLMANLNANVEEIVRQAVADKLSEKDKKTS